MSRPQPSDPPILADLAASPSPYHAVARAAELLDGVGFASIPWDQRASTETGHGWGPLRYSTNGGSLVAWRQPPSPSGFLIAAAHTDSPNLRIRTQPEITSAGFAQLGVEIYGGVLLNSWLDRDLSIAGRVMVDDNSKGTVEHLYCEPRPILRLPQLAIHLDRGIREDGLKLDPQLHSAPLWATGEASQGDLKASVANDLGITPEKILAWDLMAFDTQPPSLVGRDLDMFASGRIDNLVSAFTAIRALIESVDGATPDTGQRTPVVVLFDHEEIGSTSSTGASGSLLDSTLEMISMSAGLSRDQYLAALANSLVLSVDGAHATHPNYVERHDPSHLININDGVVIKRNANQRYATDAPGEAFVVAACRQAGVPYQYYINRNDLPCGSTIGPTTAARLGATTIDLGIAQLAMHSAREMAGVADLGYLHSALRACWSRS